MGSRVGGLGSNHLPADKALAGVPRLLDDLQRLLEDTDSADIVFILGRDEDRMFAHRVIMLARYIRKIIFRIFSNVSVKKTREVRENMNLVVFIIRLVDLYVKIIVKRINELLAITSLVACFK